MIEPTENAAATTKGRHDFVSLAVKFWRQEMLDDSGQTLVVAAICMVVLVAFLGLAIDVGQLRYQKRRMQMAADAAALAGALELSYCKGTANCSVLQTAVQDALTENGFTGSTLLTNCATASGTELQVTVSNPPCALKTDPNISNSSYVEVVVSKPQPTVFARVLGITSVLLMARAEAANGGQGNCIYALDPSGSGAIAVDLLASLTTTCGIVDESSSSSALSCLFFASIKAPQIYVVGGVSTFACDLSPTPTTGITLPSITDPLAYLPTPTVPACGTSTRTPYTGSSTALSISSTVTLHPGAYCGGIVILPGAKVTFTPGTYVLTSTKNGVKAGAGGLAIDVGSTVTGAGVTFYNYGPVGSIAFNYTSFSSGGVSLVAPTSGAYGGILFFQDPQNTSQATMIGSSSWNTVLEGSYYFPTAKVVFAFDGNVNYNILVAYDIEFAFLTFGRVTTSSGFSSNYTTLANGSPLLGAGAAVVE